MDSPLSPEGIEQALLLKKSIAVIPFDRCITSPLGRAEESAKLLINEKIPLSSDERLAEMGFGSVEGVEKDLFRAKYPEPFFNLWHHADLYDPSAFNGETFQSVADRAGSFLNDLKSEHDGSRILILSHGMILKVIFGLIWKHGFDKFWDDPVPLNTSLTHVKVTDGHFEIADFSNVSHLTDTEAISYV